MKTTRELLIIGNEILSGRKQDAHLSSVGRFFKENGVELECCTVTDDNPENIKNHFLSIWSRTRVLITTGGLGPTSDDNTKETIANLLDRPLVFSDAAKKNILHFLGKRPYKESLNNQCLIPDGANILPNKNGTASGIFIEEKGKLLFMLPGPPQETNSMLNLVLEAMVKHGEQQKNLIQKTIKAFGVGETAIFEKTQKLEKKHKNINFGYYPLVSAVEITLEGDSVHKAELEEVERTICSLFSENVAENHTAELNETVVKLLEDQSKTIACAESCTGGMLGAAITEVSGASGVFLGSFVPYHNNIKSQLLRVPAEILKQEGAVSEACAKAMASGAADLAGSDIAISVTGVAGPGGGTKEKPKGTVFIGLYENGITEALCYHFSGNRQTVRAKAVQQALDLVRRTLTLKRNE